MNPVSISQLWGRAWALFKVNWLLLLGMFILSFLVGLIPFIGSLLILVIMEPALTRACFLIAQQGNSSFEEAFQDFGALIKVFAYKFILGIVPAGLTLIGDFLMNDPIIDAIIVFIGGIISIIVALFGWAGPYAILSGRAGIIDAIGQSFSLTEQSFGMVLLAFLSLIGLMILGALPCGLGVLVVIPMTYMFLPLLYLGLIGQNRSLTPS